MSDDKDPNERLIAVEAWLVAIKKFMVIGDMNWEHGWADVRRIAINYVLRRQLEALDATVLLARQGMGHLAVGFVRPALDELLWMTWVGKLDARAAQELLNAMGRSDGIRSLKAQRSFLGDDTMRELWYPDAFLNGIEPAAKEAKAELAAIEARFHWGARSPLPSAAWVAGKAGQAVQYDYLHAAASRALHFSMGEIMRNGWGKPGGTLTTKSDNFRQYRTDFALARLPLLLLETSSAGNKFLVAAGIVENYAPEVVEEVSAAVAAMSACGQVPLVHAAEWNLTPDGPLPTPRSTRGGQA